MQTLNNICEMMLSVLESKYTKMVFELWFKDLEMVSMDSEKAVFSVKSDLKTDILNTKYLSSIREALEETVGFSIPVSVISTEKENGIAMPSFTPRPPVKKEEEEEKEKLPPIDAPAIVEKYTFENFVEGESNKFALAACRAVAKYPFVNYNPLFIHGQSGLGKTHLLYAITNEIKKTHPDVKIIYKKGEDFTNELIHAIQNGATEQFHAKYRNADVLLVDDIQFIAGKESTQEAFFHTFNALHENEKQIILTSDRPPKDIHLLEERLRTRFEWGLLADIQPPSLELRTAIIRKKAENLPTPLDGETVDYLASALKENIRQIEGVIKKIAAVSMISSTPITKAMCERIVKEFTTGTLPPAMLVDSIFETVSKTWNIPVEEIKGKKQKKEIAMARHISIYLISSMTDYSLDDIGILFGKDHSTVHYSINKIKEEMEKDRELESKLNDVIAQIRS